MRKKACTGKKKKKKLFNRVMWFMLIHDSQAKRTNNLSIEPYIPLIGNRPQHTGRRRSQKLYTGGTTGER